MNGLLSSCAPGEFGGCVLALQRSDWMYAASRLDGLDLGRQVDGQRGKKGGSCVYAEKFESRAFSLGLPKLFTKHSSPIPLHQEARTASQLASGPAGHLRGTATRTPKRTATRTASTVETNMTVLCAGGNFPEISAFWTRK